MTPRLLYPEFPAPILPLPTAENPSPAAPGGEYLPVVDENGVVTARALRSWIHGGAPDRLLHPVVHMLVSDRLGRIWLQKRGAAKKGWPLKWDFTVGGHVAYGEQPLESLVREASEEVGLADFNALCADIYVWNHAEQRELVFSYIAIGSFTPVADEAEVSEVRLWTPDEIVSSLGRGVFTPSFEYEYPRLRRSLAALM